LLLLNLTTCGKIDKYFAYNFVIPTQNGRSVAANIVGNAKGVLLKLDDVDLKILRMIQNDSQPSTTQLARKLNVAVTTVYSKIRRLEKNHIIQGYRALIDPRTLGLRVTAFVLATVSYGAQRYDLDRAVAKQIAQFPEVQEVHIISGDWDFLIKVKTADVEGVGRFLAEKLKTVRGVDKTLTCMVFQTMKETTEIDICRSQTP